jgi:hypothetical protein
MDINLTRQHDVFVFFAYNNIEIKQINHIFVYLIVNSLSHPFPFLFIFNTCRFSPNFLFNLPFYFYSFLSRLLLISGLSGARRVPYRNINSAYPNFCYIITTNNPNPEITLILSTSRNFGILGTGIDSVGLLIFILYLILPSSRVPGAISKPPGWSRLNLRATPFA